MLHKAKRERGAHAYRNLTPLDPDINIARRSKLEPIDTIAKRSGLNADEIERYGSYKAKINARAFKRLERPHQRVKEKLSPVSACLKLSKK